MKTSFALVIVAAGLSFAGVAQAAPVIYNNSIAAGTAQFSSVITGAGGTVKTDVLSGLSGGTSWTRSDFTITSTDGSWRGIDQTYLGVGRGESIGISPSDPAPSSGLTFTFINPVNAFGLMVGDWGTCCQPSSLYISFDGGATRLVATSLSYGDNPGNAVGDGYRNFVAAIDDTSTFTTVTFYGDGFGEYLTAGGTIYYATVDEGSVSTPVAVPTPATAALLGSGLLGLGFMRRRNQNRA